MQNIYALARDIKNRYIKGEGVEIVDGLSFSMYDSLREITFMSSGHYLNGDEDENGELKPFHDIITRILDNQRTAEEIDTKDMEISTDDSEYYVRASLISKFNQDWMAKSNFAKTLNDMIETRGHSGGVMVKKLEDGDHFDVEVVDWSSFSGDTVDLHSGVRAIDNFYTPAALLDEAKLRGWDMEAAHGAIELYAQANQNKEMLEQRETVGDYVLVREVSGVFPKTLMDEDDESGEYSYQVHYIAGSEFNEESDEGTKEKGVTLSSVELDKSPYKYLPYKKRTRSGKSLGIGMVERARHSQIWTNYAAQQQKYAMDYASLPLLQSSSKNLKGKNVFTQMKRGTIVSYDDGKPMTGLSLAPTSLSVLPGYMNQWQNQLDRATSTFAVSTGEDLPSGTPYRLGAILDQNAQSSFDLRREEMAIFIDEIYTEWIIPWMIKQVKKQETLSLAFSPEELKMLDLDASVAEANKLVFKKYLDGEYNQLPVAVRLAVIDAEREALINQGVKSLQKGRNRRKISDFPEGYWDQVADKLFVDIVGERRDKATMLESVNNVLVQYLQFKPQLDSDPNARKLFNQIVETAGMEPIDFNSSIASPQQPTPSDTPEVEGTAEPREVVSSAKPN